jgi:hypothetical protein
MLEILRSRAPEYAEGRVGRYGVGLT